MMVAAQTGTGHQARRMPPGPAGWDLSMHVLDIVQNSAEAGATRVAVRVDEDADGTGVGFG